MYFPLLCHWEKNVRVVFACNVITVWQRSVIFPFPIIYTISVKIRAIRSERVDLDVCYKSTYIKGMSHENYMWPENAALSGEQCADWNWDFSFG